MSAILMFTYSTSLSGSLYHGIPLDMAGIYVSVRQETDIGSTQWFVGTLHRIMCRCVSTYMYHIGTVDWYTGTDRQGESQATYEVHTITASSLNSSVTVYSIANSIPSFSQDQILIIIISNEQVQSFNMTPQTPCTTGTFYMFQNVITRDSLQ